VPRQKSALPDGTYRQQVTATDVEAAGLTNDDGWSGIWTMTVRHATYDVRCRPISDPGTDCGHSESDGPLEVGDLRGARPALYFVPSSARLSALTGCKLPPSNSLPDHCGPDDPYRVNWRLDGAQLTLSGFAAEGSGLGVKAWTKIS
jgi:hypothetical protein